MQRVKDYMYIIHSKVFETFGTYLPIGKNFTEQMKFSFYDENLPLDDRKKLALIAAKRVSDKKDLPEGIYLADCTIIME